MAKKETKTVQDTIDDEIVTPNENENEPVENTIDVSVYENEINELKDLIETLKTELEDSKTNNIQLEKHLEEKFEQIKDLTNVIEELKTSKTGTTTSNTQIVSKYKSGDKVIIPKYGNQLFDIISVIGYTIDGDTLYNAYSHKTQTSVDSVAETTLVKPTTV